MITFLCGKSCGMSLQQNVSLRMACSGNVILHTLTINKNTSVLSLCGEVFVVERLQGWLL